MQVHGLIALLARAMFSKTRTTAFNLNFAASFLLDMLNVSTTLSHNLSAKIKAWNRLQVNRDVFFRPFALLLRSATKKVDFKDHAEVILDQTHPVQTAPVRADEIAVHRPNLGALASSSPQSERPHFPGPLWWCW
jgi:hypothetical protein